MLNILVPPDQPGTSFTIRSKAFSTFKRRTIDVMDVKEVENTKASAFEPTPRIT